MNLGVTISTAIGEKLLKPCGGARRMAGMALQAEKGHRNTQQVVIYRTVGRMTVSTIFSYVSMFEGKRTLFFHMAPGAGFPGGGSLEELVLSRAMHIMAVSTGHLLFNEGMMGKQIILHFDLGMAAITEFRHFFTTYLLLGALMKFVTVKTTDIIQRMGTGVPVGKGGYGCSGMTFETDE
jgi:hypothetical protein